MISTFIVSQILVGIALLTDFASFQYKDRKKIVLFLCISSILIAVHYFLLEKNTAGVLIFISVIRFITAYFSTRKSIMYAIIALNILGFAITYASVASLIIFIAMTLCTIGAFQKEDKYLRILFMMGTGLMIAYDVLIFSPMAIFLESFFFASNLIGYYRFYIRKDVKVRVE